MSKEPRESKQLKDLRRTATAYLEPGEQILAGVTATNPGFADAGAGGAAGGLIGALMMRRAGAKARQSQSDAASAGLTLASNMAVALTGQRLLFFSIKGIRASVKDLLSAVPLAEVDAIEAKLSKRTMTKQITLTVRGVSFLLETTWAEPAEDLGSTLVRLQAELPGR